MVIKNMRKLVKTSCGLAKYDAIASRKDAFSRLRLIWFVFFAAIRDWHISTDNQINESES